MAAAAVTSAMISDAMSDSKSMVSRDSGEGGSKGFSEEGSGVEGSGSGGEQVVVKEQVKAVVGDLENMLGELKTVVGDLRTLVSQIDVVTSKIDEEYGPDGEPIVHDPDTGDGPRFLTNDSVEMRTGGELNTRAISNKTAIEGRSHCGVVEMRVDKRRRSASMLENGTPKREVPNVVRHSLSQPFDNLPPNPKDWIFKAPIDLIGPKVSDSPQHSTPNNRRSGCEQVVCQAHIATCSKMDDILSTPKKDDIIICTPGSVCYMKEHSHHGTPQHSAPNNNNRRTSGNNKLDRAIYENVPIVSCRTPSKASSNNSRSPRTSSGSCKGHHSPRTSASSGIGNSTESANGNNKSYGSCGSKRSDKSLPSRCHHHHKSHHHNHYHHHQRSSSASVSAIKHHTGGVGGEGGTHLELGKGPVTNYLLQYGGKGDHTTTSRLVSVADDVQFLLSTKNNEQQHLTGKQQHQSAPTGTSSSDKVLYLGVDGNKGEHQTNCSPSPDSDYCGVYEREMDLKLELIFEDDYDTGVDDRRPLDLVSHPDYGSTYDRERVSRWAAYTVVNIGSMPMSDDQCTVDTPCSETSSDILNDNVFITTAAELQRVRAASAKRNWSSAYCKQSLESPDTG